MRPIQPETVIRESPTLTPRTVGLAEPVAVNGSRPVQGTAVVLALQRTAGNKAVGELLAPPGRSGGIARPRPVGAAPISSPAIRRILAHGDRREAAMPTGTQPLPEVDGPSEEGAQHVSIKEPTDSGGEAASGDDGDEADPTPETETEGRRPEEQSALIVADSQRSANEVAAVAAARRVEIAAQFGGFRGRVTATLDAASSAVRGFVAARQGEVKEVSNTMLTAGQSLLTSTVASGRQLLEQSRATLQEVADSAIASVVQPVNSAAGRITGLIDGLSLPDLPGVSTVRAGLRSLAGRAADVVTGGLASVRTLVSSALQHGTQLLGSVVSAAGDAARSLLGRIVSGVQGAVESIAGTLSRLATAAITQLRTAVAAHLLPAVGRAESALLRNLSTAEQQAQSALRDGRTQQLQTVNVGGDGDADDPVDAARTQNASIVAVFRERTEGILGSVFAAVNAAAAAVGERFGQVVGRVSDAIGGPLAQILGRIRELGGAVRDFLQTLLSDLGSAVTEVVDGVRAAVRDPVDAILRFASDAAGRVGQFLSGIAGRVLRGDFSLPSASDLVGDQRGYRGPITRPRPGPITLPGLKTVALILALVGALVLIYVPQLAVAVAAVLTWLGVTVGPAAFLVIVGVVALIALAALLLLLYAIYRAVKPSPGPGPKPKPKPKPKPVTVTHKTAVAAPDGSGKSRNDVGVGEKVVFTGSASGTWTATGGSPTTGSGKKFTWTAPNRAASVTVTLTTGSSSATEALSVLEPASITAVRNSTIAFRKGRAGAGMKLSFHYHPKTVSFGNTEAKEVSGPATNITGYYRKHYSDADLEHDSGDTFFPVKDDNVDSSEDTASTEDPFKPYEEGTFDWVIPNHFKVKTEGGDGKKFTEVTQAFKMLDDTGRIRIDKAGASVERSPSDP